MPFKKHIRPGKVEASPDGLSLVVNFTTEITHLDEDGMPGRVEKSPDKREVPIGDALRGLRLEDIPSLAQDLVEKCRYIPAKKTGEVEKVLAKMLAMQTDAPFPRPKGFAPGDSQSASNRSNRSCAQESVLDAQLVDLLPDASIQKLDDYVEEMYEEQMEAKAAGAQRLLRVCTQVELLEQVSEHPSLLGVLSRELRENAKRSYELAVAITGIFLCLSRFSRFHGTLLASHCGDVTMRVLEYESRRRNVLQKDLQLSQGQMVARGSQVSSAERAELEFSERRSRALLDRQDHLLQLCLQVLRSLSEDTKLEFKLVKQKLGQLLIPLLSRHQEDLLVRTLSMLHKLSVFEQNKDLLVSSEEAPVRLAELVGQSAPEVSSLALRVCYNLSLDEQGRAALTCQAGLVARLVAAISQQGTRQVALKLLYNLSMDASARSRMTKQHPTLAGLALQLVARGTDQVEEDAVALLVNLSADEATACLLLAEEAFVPMMLRAISNADATLLKVLRHVALHAASRPMLLDTMGRDDEVGPSFEWLFELVQLAMRSAADRHEVLAEVLGTLAALDCPSPEVPWPELCDGGLLELLPRLLMVGFSEDDVVLESVQLMSVLALDPPCAVLLAGSKAIPLLADWLASKRADADLMVQLLFLLRCLLLCEETCEVLLRTDALKRVMEALRSEGGPKDEEAAQAVQAAAEELLHLVMAVESRKKTDTWTKRIQAFRFKLHNEEWCHALQASPPPPRGEKGEGRDRKGRHKETSSETRAPSLEATMPSRRSSQGPWAETMGFGELEEKRGRKKTREKRS
eukprot:TRINITY_DN28869_c0_g1_i2.p1 TRINITY_DN28869_c0_g1~~TRINITY_DN28869_c0_g1_i2.p1  ORF type:complete len:802 (+),score=205.29 TRINITY_DN28869_c0_g1_i2:91-2496(+)